VAASTSTSTSIHAGGDPRVGRFWWIPLVAGVLTVIIGFAALVYPGPTLLAVGLLLGGYLVFWGMLTILRGVSGDTEAATVWRVALVLLGVITALAGLLLLVRPGQSVLTAAWILGFWWVLSGILQLVTGIAVADRRVWNLLIGLLGIVAGAIILAQPEIGLITLVWIVSIGLIFQGMLEISAGLTVRRLHKAGAV
jgi:uncharacterized membrane protein HdeD (DUF308 family)